MSEQLVQKGMKGNKQVPRSYYIYQKTVTRHEYSVNNKNMQMQQQNNNNNNKLQHDNEVNEMKQDEANQGILIKEQQNVQINSNQKQQKQIVNINQQQHIPPYIGRNPCTFIYDNKLYILQQQTNQQQQIQQQQLLLSSTTNNNINKQSQQQYMTIAYFDINTGKFNIQPLSIVNLQLLQRSYQIQSSTFRSRQSSPAQSTRNRQPKLYYPGYLQNVSVSSNNKNVVYLFGGVYRQMLEYTNVMWKVNMKVKTIQMVKQQGEQIQAREAATLIYYNNNNNSGNNNNSTNNNNSSWLILYGGYNLTTCTVYNDFYCFNTNNSTWYIIETDFQNLLTPRIHPSLTYNPSTHKLYLFGGLLHDYNGNQRLLNDMYQLTLEDIDNTNGEKKSKKYKGLLTSKTILPKLFDQYPSRRAGHKCVWVNESILLMVGGQKEFQLKKYQQQHQYQYQQYQQYQQHEQLMFLNRNYHNDIWIFDTKSQKWSQLLCQNTQTQMKQNAHFGIQFIKQNDNGIYECVVLGGQSLQQLKDSNQNDNSTLCRLRIDMRLYQQWTKQHINANKQKQQRHCDMCTQISLNDIYYTNNNNNNIDKHSSNTLPADQLDSFIINGMKFPFTAIGLLTHSSIQRQSSLVAITYRQYLQTTQYPNQITIQDDSYLQFKANQVNSKIHLLGNKDMSDILGVNDKKYKSLHLREYTLVQFCNLFKMACLRLGQEVFWITGNNHQEILVFLLRKQKVHYNNNKNDNNKDKNAYNNNKGMDNNTKQTYPLNNNTPQNQKLATNINPKQQQTPNQQYQQVYRSYFYAFSSDDHKLLPGYSQQTRTQIMKCYHLTIKHFIKERQCKGSILRIKKLRKVITKNEQNQQIEKFELTPLVEKNAIIIQNQLFNKMENQQLKNLAFQQSIDINLSAYLSVLFLNRSASIMVKVNSIIPPKPISTSGTISGTTSGTTSAFTLTQTNVLNNTNNPTTSISATPLNANNKLKQQTKKSNYINLDVEQEQNSQKNKQKSLQQQKQKQTQNRQSQSILQVNKQSQSINNNKKQMVWKNNSFVSNVVKYIETHPKEMIKEKNKSIINNQNQQSIVGVGSQIMSQSKRIQQQQVEKQKQVQKQNKSDINQRQNFKKWMKDQKQKQYIQIIDQEQQQQEKQLERQKQVEQKKQTILQKQKQQSNQLIENQQKLVQIIQVQVQAQIKQDKQSKQKQESKQNQNQKMIQIQVQKQKQIEIQKQQKQQRKQPSLQTIKQTNKQVSKQPLKQPQKPLVITKQPFTIPQVRQIINSFTEIPPQFMLPKIDLLKAKQQLIQIDLDPFAEFQCKIIEIYFWKNKSTYFNHQEIIHNQYEKKKQIGNQNIVGLTGSLQAKQYQPPLLFPNGLLIYHKNRLIKRYQPQLGIFNPFFKSSVSNLIGVIEINQKIPVNMFNTCFINEQIQLQKLYSRIQHVAYLYNKMYQIPVEKRQRSKNDGDNIINEKKRDQIDCVNKENEMVNLSVVNNNQQVLQGIQGTKRIKQQ